MTADLLGSVTELWDGSGAVVEAYGYDAWGNLSGWSGPDRASPITASAVGNAVGFAGLRSEVWGEPMVSLTRLYRPEEGRWLWPDPLGFAETPVLDHYSRMQPTSRLDPYGTLSRNNHPALPPPVLPKVPGIGGHCGPGRSVPGSVAPWIDDACQKHDNRYDDIGDQYGSTEYFLPPAHYPCDAMDQTIAADEQLAEAMRRGAESNGCLSASDSVDAAAIAAWFDAKVAAWKAIRYARCGGWWEDLSSGVSDVYDEINKYDWEDPSTYMDPVYSPFD